MRFLEIFQGKTSAAPTEAELLSAYRATGDIQLLGNLYAPYMEMIFAVCYKYLRDEEESKDAVMQVFEKLILDLKVHEVTNFGSWLHSVARNYCLMRIRAGKALPGMMEEAYAESIVSEDDAAVFELDDRLAMMQHCLGTLAESQRLAVELFYLGEKCYREICEETGFDLNKVKSYIQNGKRNLKICLDKNGRH